LQEEVDPTELFLSFSEDSKGLLDNSVPRSDAENNQLPSEVRIEFTLGLEGDNLRFILRKLTVVELLTDVGNEITGVLVVLDALLGWFETALLPFPAKVWRNGRCDFEVEETEEEEDILVTVDVVEEDNEEAEDFRGIEVTVVWGSRLLSSERLPRNVFTMQEMPFMARLKFSGIVGSGM